jgi:hypothetical protein
VDSPASVRQVAVPAAVRALCTLPRIDYEDAFILDAGEAQDRTAEEWVQAIFEEAPISLRRALQQGWTALGLKLGSSGSGRSVLSWELRRSTRGSVLLAAGSRIGMPAELVIKRYRRTVLVSTFLQHQNPIARAVWAGVEPVHQRVVPHVLSSAGARREARGR